VNEPDTLPFLMTMFDMFAAPVTLNAGGMVQLVGLLPAGEVQDIFKLPATGAGSATPLKMVAHLLAEPGMLKVSLPVMLPKATKPAVPMQGLAELPRVAFTMSVSVFAVPPFMRAGEKLTTPFHTPPAGLHFTVPGWFTGFDTA